MTNLSESDRIIKAKISLQKNNPFWAYLSLYLKFKEVPKGRMACDTIGVSLDGNVSYVKEFVKKLNDNELVGVLAHEICHIAYLSELRQGNRDREGWNFATDLTINSLLKRNNFSLPFENDSKEKPVIPDYNDEFDIGMGKKIKKCSEKTSEEIYDLLPKIKMKGVIYVIGSGKDKGKELGRSFDEHIEGKNKKGEKLSKKEKEKLKEKWLDRVQEAYTIAKMKGDVPKGIERLIGRLFEEEIDWKALLQKYITNQIPYNHTWQKSSKRSIATGIYMPDVLKEKISVCIAIDLSGSIGELEYSSFISEMIGLAKAYQERISMKFYSHDTSAYEGEMVENGNLDKIMDLKLKGGGGTSHQEIFNLIQEKERDCKCVIFLTDGFSDIEQIPFEEYSFDKLFVITKEGDEKCLEGKNCEVIKLKGRD